MSDFTEDFTGRVALVTGGGSGIGREIALAYARRGGTVVVLGRRPEPLAETVSLVEQLGRQASAEPCDVRDADAVQAAIDRVVERYGRLDALVNNAAGNFVVPAEKLSPNGWRAVVDIVLNGTFFCSREFGRRHLAAKTPGVILNVGASYAWTGGPGFAHSAAGKAGIKNLTETLAVEWGPYGIRVNGLVPGLMPHDDEVAAIRAVPERRKSDGARSPALRVGHPRELGWAATFLASPFAAYISGHTLVVDGANWQRRSLLMPEFVPIRDQLGKGPFQP
jgi:NAD(P)-dependent dehydrogenase (short-subunit alcohol dehydrogenase family)